MLKKLLTLFQEPRSVSENNASRINATMAPFYLIEDFFERHEIDPNPTNYQLVYRHQVSGETGLDGAINALIANKVVDQDIPEDPEVSLGADLVEISEFAASQLEAIQVILAKSNQEATGYGAELEIKCSEAQNAQIPSSFLETLMTLTKTMISKTKETEAELKSRKTAIVQLQTSLAEAKLRADTDPLTGLSNRRALDRELGAACERAKSSQQKLSLAICDVDHFKSINDKFGHVTGDRVLQLVSEIMQDHCAGSGSIFRFGGEEFVILFEGIDREEAADIVCGAKKDLAARKVVKRETGEALGSLTFSAGISDYIVAPSPEDLLSLSDKLLYRAKVNGRNDIQVATN